MIHKPIIKIQAYLVPLIPELNVPIARKKVDKTEYRNWNDRTEFVDYVDQLYVPPTSTCYAHIICQCGTDFAYENEEDLPSENVTCNCGRKVIEYGN